MIKKSYPQERTIDWHNALVYTPETAVVLLLSFQTEEDTIDTALPQVGIYEESLKKNITPKGKIINERPTYWAYIKEPFDFSLNE